MSANQSEWCLSDWLTWIERGHPALIDFGQKRLQALACLPALVDFACPVITIAGTNGKGSTAGCLEAIYTAAGYKVGCYTSPHLLRFNERIRIRGVPCADAELCQAFAWLEQQRREISLSFFEFTTLAALRIFQTEACDVLILEIGLGGRLDVVNQVTPTLTMLTKIGMDHQDWLGVTRAAITAEKAGIMREQTACICAERAPPANLQCQAAALAAPLVLLGREFDWQHEADEDTWKIAAIHSPALPKVKIDLDLAAAAVYAVDYYKARLPISWQSICQGLQSLALPGRLQCCQDRGVAVLLDVAHNTHAARYVADYLSKSSTPRQRRFIVLATRADKPMLGMLEVLCPWADGWFLAPLGDVSDQQAWQIRCLASLADLCLENVQLHTDVNQAYGAAWQVAQPSDEVVVLGSFQTVEPILRLLEADDLNPRCVSL